MKCSRCGVTARDINGMRKHYLKKHPRVMHKKKTAKWRKKCSHCGRRY